jgi:hypothetical protein
MKQKETNVVEAACARVSGEMATRQNYAMMTFTVVTVLFVRTYFDISNAPQTDLENSSLYPFSRLSSA